MNLHDGAGLVLDPDPPEETASAFLERVSTSPEARLLYYRSIFDTPPFVAPRDCELYRVLQEHRLPERAIVRAGPSWLLPPLTGLAFVLGVLTASAMAVLHDDHGDQEPSACRPAVVYTRTTEGTVATKGGPDRRSPAPF
jgi:hypothetical protein